MSNNTQYTVDTMIPVSKNFLKKTLIKNDATKKASNEMIELYKKALNKKPKVIEHIKYIKKEPSMTEQYHIFEKIKLTKQLELQKIKEREERILQKQKEEELKKMIILQQSEEYKKYEKEGELIRKCFIEPVKKKKETIRMYKNILDVDPDNEQIKISAYNLLIGK
jgi:hypothetical protein